MKIKELFYEDWNKKYSWRKDEPPNYVKRGWFDVATIFAVGIGITAVIVVGLLFAAVSLTRWDCNNFERNTGTETKYKNLTCYAKNNGKWVDKENIILTLEGK